MKIIDLAWMTLKVSTATGTVLVVAHLP